MPTSQSAMTIFNQISSRSSAVRALTCRRFACVGGAAAARQPAAPAQDRLSAIAGGAFSHDVLNVHLDRVFRQVELRGNQLVRKSKLQFRQHLLLARRELDRGS